MVSCGMIKLVIFDMDGTLFDTERIQVQKWIEAARELGIPLNENALYEKIGLSAKDSKKYLQETCGEGFDYDSVKALKRQLLNKHVAEKGTPIKDGLPELMKFLEEQKIKTAIATSRSRENAFHFLTHAGKDFDKQFDCIVTGDMIEKGKPNPDIFLRVAKELGMPAKNSLVIEDAPNGIRAATAARMRVVMVPDSVQPDEELKKSIYAVKNNLREVIDVISEINRNHRY